MSTRKFSDYCEGLENSAKERYRAKLDLIAVGLDEPYTIVPGTGVSDCMPEVEYPDCIISL